MDANKFATMLHRNSTKIRHTLVLAALEWTLIILLLLNALLQYMIIKFANYFGLKPPCLWCSRIDHLMEPKKGSTLHKDHLCEVHGEEVSKLGYCSTHQKLADYQSMCEDCSSSRPDFCGFSMKFNFVPWVKETGVIHSDENMVNENGVEWLECSCCGVILERQAYAPCILINPSNYHFEYDIQKAYLIREEGENDDYGTKDERADHTGRDFIIEHFDGDHGFKSKSEKQMLSSIDGVLEEDIQSNEEKFGIIMTDPSSDKNVQQHCHERDASFEIPQLHLEFLVDCTGQQLVPVESISSTTEENEIQNMVQKNSDPLKAHLEYEYDIAAQVSGPENIEKTKSQILELMEAQQDENCSLVPAKDCDPLHEQVTHVNVQDTSPYFLAVSAEVSKMHIYKTEKEASTHTETALVDSVERVQTVAIATEDLSPFIMSDTDTEVSIGTEIPDLNSTEDTYTEDRNCLQEEASASCTNFHVHFEHGSETDSQETVDLSTFMIELNDYKLNSQSSVYFEINGDEEEKLCERPSLDSHYHVKKTLLFHERKDSEAEESLEGSDISEFDDEVMTVECLKSTLRAERKALNVAYAELEEERNASAISANQTMAMINRLQEEKAALQMDALHYQRMMEEKSEYDQEAMQIMNDLMVKIDGERKELEEELEVCRKKLLVYEAKEDFGMLQRSKDESAKVGFSSVSCRNEENSDEISINLYKEENGSYDHQGNGDLNTPVGDVLYLLNQFGNIDEERRSIVDQLKDLDNRGCKLGEVEQHIEDVMPFFQESGKHIERSSDISGEEIDQLLDKYSRKMNGIYH